MPAQATALGSLAETDKGNDVVQLSNLIILAQPATVGRNQHHIGAKGGKQRGRQIWTSEANNILLQH